MQTKKQLKDMRLEIIKSQRQSETQATHLKKESKQNIKKEDDKIYHGKRKKKTKSWIF